VSTASLRTRVALASVVAILVAVISFGLAANALVGHELHASLDRSLKRGATDVVRLTVSAPAVLASPGALDAPSPGRTLLVEVLDRHGRILGRSLSLGARLLPKDAGVTQVQKTGRARFDYLTLSGRRLRRYTAPVADVGGRGSGGVVMAAAEVADITTTTKRLRKLLLITGLAATVLAGALAAFLTARGLRPLRRLSRAAAEIERTGDPSQRLPQRGAAEEIADLTAVLNRMLGALESARESERRFLADASHELRTPVAALAGNLEYAQRHGTDPELLADLREDATRLARLVDQLLVLERQGQAAPAAEPVDLAELAADAAAASDRVDTGTLEPVTVAGDREALARALANLIDNALVHGPEDGRARVTVQARDGRALLSVSDEGPGPSADEREHILERFWRGDAAAGRPGAGLGLPIVAAIARSHGGAVHVERSTFTIELPARGVASQAAMPSIARSSGSLGNS
jgi:signal transduction histidine kinase